MPHLKPCSLRLGLRPRATSWANPDRRARSPSTRTWKPRKLSRRSAARRSRPRRPAARAARPHADLVVGRRRCGSLPSTCEPSFVGRGNGGGGGRLAAHQRRLGPVRLVEGGVVLRARVRLQLQPDRLAGELAQSRPRPPPRSWRPSAARRRLSPNSPAGASSGATRTRNVTPSPLPVGVTAVANSQPHRRGLRQGQRDTRPAPCRPALEPRRMDGDRLARRPSETAAFWICTDAAMLRLRAGPADGMVCGGCRNDDHHGAPHGPAATAPASGPAASGSGCQAGGSAVRAGPAAAWSPGSGSDAPSAAGPRGERGVGVDRIMGRVRAGPGHRRGSRTSPGRRPRTWNAIGSAGSQRQRSITASRSLPDTGCGPAFSSTTWTGSGVSSRRDRLRPHDPHRQRPGPIDRRIVCERLGGGETREDQGGERRPVAFGRRAVS